MSGQLSHDLTSLFSQGQIKYLVQSKTSGQVLGFAFLLPNVPAVTNDPTDIEFVAMSGSSGYQFSQPPVKQLHPQTTSVEDKCKLISDLNISSEDDSADETLSSQYRKDKHSPTNQDQINASVSRLPTLTPQQNKSDAASFPSSSISTSLASPDSVTLSSSSLKSDVPLSASITQIQSSGTVNKSESLSIASEISASITQIQSSGTVNKSGRLSIASEIIADDLVVSSSQTIHIPSGPLSRYEAFFETVVGGNRNQKMGRCTLCLAKGVDKIMHYSNMVRHIKCLHLAPVQCGVCGKQFSGGSRFITAHESNCRQVKEQNNNYKNKFQVDQRQGDFISLYMSSSTVQGVKLKIKVKKEARLKKAMKKFGHKCKMDYKSLNFLLGGRKLTGEEIAGKLEGREIEVEGAI